MCNERLGEPMAGVVENAAEITSEPAFVELEISLPVSQYVRAEGSATEASEALAPHLSFLLSEWVNATQAGRRAAV